MGNIHLRNEAIHLQYLILQKLKAKLNVIRGVFKHVVEARC